jgi:hypothetical protein
MIRDQVILSRGLQILVSLHVSGKSQNMMMLGRKYFNTRILYSSG